jgi:uncharacterized protein (UPF0335 family)
MESSQISTNTLQHVTKHKLEKLAYHIEKFEVKKRDVIDEASKKQGLRDRLKLC